MEPIAPILQTTPVAVAPIIEVPQVATQPMATLPPTSSDSFFGNKIELVHIGFLALFGATFIMEILRCRKVIEASNSYKNLQSQINQIKLSMHTK